jgi:multidrug efflux pump subunit AcrA (membrane-fusion protein)
MTTNPKHSDTASRKGTFGKIVGAVVLFACVVGMGYLLYQQKARAQAEPGPATEETTQSRVAVVTTPAALRDFERSLMVQGNVEARHFAMVSPRVPGIIETIPVDEGDAVIADQTILFRTDAVALEKNVQISQHALTVAQCAQREAAANLEKTRVDFRKAKLDYERFERLYQQQAVTADAFEQQQSRYAQLEAVVKLATAQVDLTGAQAEQAQAALTIAEKDLADATINAPIDGTVSARLQEPGEMGDVGKPVIRIDDTSVVEVAAFLPAQYYSAIVPGQTAMRIDVSGIDIGRHVITYKSPTIQPKLRSFEIKCILNDPPAGVAPGAMAQLVVVLESRQGIGVPSAALEQRGGRSVVFVIENDTARQVPVGTGIETDGWTEAVDSELAEGAAVVTMGQYMVQAGTPVTVQKESK